MNADRIKESFQGFKDLEKVVEIAEVGVQVAVAPGSNLERELDYGNHWSADKWKEEVWQRRW